MDTILIGWILTGELKLALNIGAAELVTKMLLYYLHERVWYKLRIFKDNTSRLRHVMKTITWRFVGTIDTIILGWLISGRAEIGISLGGIELVTKMILYYLHERVWYRSNFGVYDKTES
jgi:uncharacterized membrane protein